MVTRPNKLKLSEIINIVFRTYISFLTVAFWQVFSGLRWIVFKMAQSVSFQYICFEYMFTIFSDLWDGFLTNLFFRLICWI
jgi:hypothetical protein